MLYFDANATTPCAPEVQEAMRPYWSDAFANASSPHRAGRLPSRRRRGRGTPTAKALGLEPSIRRSKSVLSDMHVVTISSVI